MDRIKNIKFISFALLLLAGFLLPSATVRAQTEETTRKLVVDRDGEVDEVEVEPMCDTNAKCCMSCNPLALSFSGDFGAASIMSKAGGVTSTANGIGWAVGANLNWHLNCCCKSDNKYYLSAGLELRNFNATTTTTDIYDGKAYNNLHYWYAGLPIAFTMVNSTKGAGGGTVAVSYYGQVGATLGLTLNVNNVYSDQGSNSNVNLTPHYNTWMVQPFVSAGVSISCPKKTYLIGPYASYSITNLISDNGVTENILNYGIRLNTIF